MHTVVTNALVRGKKLMHNGENFKWAVNKKIQTNWPKTRADVLGHLTIKET